MIEQNLKSWTFLTNHAHVMICLELNPQLRMRDIALKVGITERMVLRIISDLTEAGILVVEKEGRRNIYQIDKSKALRHPLESHRSVNDLLKLVS